jgi:RNA polymerase sigma-70 factor (ECF subfamily)
VHAQEIELRALMLAALAGDAAGYRLLLETLQQRLAAYFRRRLTGDPAEVDDLVQEALIAIHTRRGTYDRTQLFTAWAYAIARHKLIDHYRRRGRAVKIPFEESGLFVPDDSGSVDARLDIERALQTLPPATRALIQDIKLREYSNAEAAAARGMTETAVKVAVHRGLKKVAAFLRTEPEKRP